MTREERLSKVPEEGGYIDGIWRHKRTGTVYVDVWVPFPECPIWRVLTANSVYDVRAVNLEEIDE